MARSRGPDLAQTIGARCDAILLCPQEVEGSCNNRHGFIISVLEIELDNQMSGLLQASRARTGTYVPTCTNACTNAQSETRARAYARLPARPKAAHPAAQLEPQPRSMLHAHLRARPCPHAR